MATLVDPLAHMAAGGFTQVPSALPGARPAAPLTGPEAVLAGGFDVPQGLQPQGLQPTGVPLAPAAPALSYSYQQPAADYATAMANLQRLEANPPGAGSMMIVPAAVDMPGVVAYAQPPTKGETPFYKKGWFYAIVGVVIAVIIIAIVVPMTMKKK